MTAGPPRSAQRVQDALAALGIHAMPRELPASTRTAVEAASAVGCSVAEIVKSLVFRAANSDRPVLVLVDGASRVDVAKLSAVIGEPVERATPDFVRERTGFAIGGVAPLGHLVAPETIVDEGLLRFETVWAAAGTPHSVVPLRAADLATITGGRVAEVASSA